MSLLAWLFLMSAHPQGTLRNEPVHALNLQRYAGLWHEIAHLPMFFQRQCTEDITATYTLNPDGTVQVRNACRTRDGSIDQAVGLARSGTGPGMLKVRFAPRWLSWLPWVWADYWVVDLDPDYQWAVVGSPSKKYMWILSRSPTMPPSLFMRLKHRAAARGYPVDKLVEAAPAP